MNYIDVLKALADFNRLSIMCFLLKGKKCVCEIEELLSISQSSTSKHLNKLRMAGLIEAEKKAQWVHYSIPDKVYSDFPFMKELLNDATIKGIPAHINVTNYDCE
ncbi:ArsR/SmtB family transcription factor [Dendrosporobacter sp. 1207_IL3150]|uniref:ArsR/SmtB family transcription factor n=1 Tax=Dendrosporobacter sp. 1207_IL3150 TaxID=3084054 RepID=UPI002FD9621E